jgi:hypothetical protein
VVPIGKHAPAPLQPTIDGAGDAHAKALKATGQLLAPSSCHLPSVTNSAARAITMIVAAIHLGWRSVCSI